MRESAAGELEAGIPVPDIEIEFVVGNHDMQYLRRIPGAGTFVELYDEVAESLNEINVKAAATVGDYLITHAGVTGQWAKRFLELEDDYTARSVCAQLNNMFEQGDEESLAALNTAGPRRGGKDLPGPLWADGSELCDDPLAGHQPNRRPHSAQVRQRMACQFRRRRNRRRKPVLLRHVQPHARSNAHR